MTVLVVRYQLILLLAAAVVMGQTAGKREQFKNADVLYDWVSTAKGEKLRTFVTRPRNTRGKLPAIFFVGWLSCDSVELRADPRGVDRLVQDVVRKSKALVFRVDKPGVGDSEGDCARTDFTTELEGYRRAFAAFRQHPRVDAARVVLLDQQRRRILTVGRR